MPPKKTTKGKEKEPEGRRPIVNDDTASERYNNSRTFTPENRTQSDFVTPTAGGFPVRALSPSISSYYGQQDQSGWSPLNQPVFGTAQPSMEIPGVKPFEDNTIISPMPKQLTRPITIDPPPLGTGFDAGPSNLIPTAQPVQPEGNKLPVMTKGSTSRAMSSGDREAQDERWIEQVEVVPLRMIIGPLQDLSKRDECYSSVHIEFCATQPLWIMANDPKYGIALTDRWVEAMNIGSKYLNRNFGIKTKFDNAQLSAPDRVLLKDVFNHLDDALQNIEKYADKKKDGYRISKERLLALTGKLLKLQSEMDREFAIQAEPMPAIPLWGLKGNSNLFWNANDFEILSACYREEVTQFCVRIMNVYNRNRAHEFIPTDPILPQTSKKVLEGKRTTIQQPEEPRKERLFHDAPISHSTRVHSFTNRNASIFRNPSRNTSSQKMTELLSKRPTFISTAPDPNDPDGDDDDDNGGGRPPRRGGNDRPSGRPPTGPTRRGDRPPPGSPSPPDPSGDPPPNPPTGNGGGRPGRPTIPQFDSKLKVDIIPIWDGDTDELGRWLLKINRLSERSEVVYQQLGYLVPTRLSGAAELWYYSQSSAVRSRIERDWGTLKNGIAAYYMNRNYLERQRARANKARYRQPGYYRESPSEYFIRKLELLEIIYNYSEGELINEIMAGAPSYWSTILAPHLYDSIEDFQTAIKFQEDNLLRVGVETSRFRQDTYLTNRDSKNPFLKTQTNIKPAARVNAVGWSKNVTNPPFPKDDSNVSPRGTPEDKGGRPCRHCGSGKHWDLECKYARKGERKARVNTIEASPEDARAQEEYDELYYGLETDSEEEQEDLDFH